MVPPAKKLEDLIHLAELCVDLLQQNEEHYAEVMSQSFCSPLVLFEIFLYCYFFAITFDYDILRPHKIMLIQNARLLDSLVQEHHSVMYSGTDEDDDYYVDEMEGTPIRIQGT